MDFLKQNNFRYIVIIIIIILAVINLCKINSQENFKDLLEDQNLGGHKVTMNDTNQVMFGNETLTHKLTNVDTLTVDGSTLLKGELEINSTIRKTRANEQNLHLVSDKVLHLMGKEGVHIYKCQDSSECNTWDGASGNLRVGNDLTVDASTLVRGNLNVLGENIGMSAWSHILSSGDIHIRPTGNLYLITGSTTIISRSLNGSGNLRVEGTANGNTFTNLSDRRLKENIENISQNDKDKVLQLVPKTYNMIDDDKKSKRYGLIAQEVEELYPELVNTNETDGMKSMNYIELIPLLLEQIKELKKSVPNQNIINIDGVTLNKNELSKLKQLINM